MYERMKNFMRIPNKMWERLYKIKVPMQQRRVFDYIYRQTIGYPIHPRKVQTAEIARDLGIDSADVRDLLVELEGKNMTVRNGKYKEIKKDYTLWGVGEHSPTNKQGNNPLVDRGKTPHSVGEDSPTVKETLKKNKKKGIFSKKVGEKQQESNERNSTKLRESLGIPIKREKIIQ